MDSMTVEEKYERLEYMLQYAATKADSLKGLLSKYCDENGNIIPADTARFRRAKRDKYDNRLKQLEQDVRKMEDTALSAQRERDEAIVERDRLLDNLHGPEAQTEDGVANLDTRDSASVQPDARLEKLQGELEAVGAARDAAQAGREDLADRIVRLEEELNAARASSRGLSEEMEALQRSIESLSASDTEFRSDREKLATQLAEVREEADRLRKELAVAVKSARNGNSNDGVDLSPVAVQSAPVSVEGELVSQLGDPLMDSYLRFLHTKSVKDGDSSDE